MTFQTTYPDYQVIVNELIKGCKPELTYKILSCKSPERSLDYRNSESRFLTLKQLRTISISGSRQSGKTRWAMDFLFSNRNNTVLFTKHVDLIRSIQMERHGSFLSEVEKEDISNRVQHLDYLKKYFDHFFTDTDDAGEIERIPVFEKAPKFIIVDDASIYLHFHSKVFYNWIADTADEDPVIILIG